MAGDQIRRKCRQLVILVRRADIQYDVVPDSIATLIKTVAKCRKMESIRDSVEHTDHGDRRLLRARRKRPRRRAAEKRDELATAAHSITSSASASSVGGTSSPSA